MNQINKLTSVQKELIGKLILYMRYCHSKHLTPKKTDAASFCGVSLQHLGQTLKRIDKKTGQSIWEDEIKNIWGDNA